MHTVLICAANGHSVNAYGHGKTYPQTRLGVSFLGMEKLTPKSFWGGQFSGHDKTDPLTGRQVHAQEDRQTGPGTRREERDGGGGERDGGAQWY